MRITQGLTYIDKALILANQEIFVPSAGMRSSPEILKIAVVMTDGIQTRHMGPYVQLHLASKPLSDRVDVYCLGIGNSIDVLGLVHIASTPDNLYSIGHLDMEDDIREFVWSKIICRTVLPTYPLDVWYLWDSLKERSSSTKWMVKSLKYDNVSQYNFTSANSLDFELHLTPSSTPLIDLVAEYIPSVFTMCLWTKHDGEEIYVKLQERKSSDRYIMMNISKIVAITVKLSSKSSFLKLDINMMTTWHFYCIEVNIKEISFYFDGKIAIRQQKFKGSYRDEGRLQVGYVNQKNADTAPVLAYLNIWKSALGDHILARMAFGCGEAHINNSVIVSWQLFSGLKEKNVRRKSPASCKVRKDKAMLLEGRSESILIGPVMSKTSKYASLCFYFTYMMLGESKKALEVEVINKEDMKSMINPIWYARDYANGEWHLGSVPIRSTMSYQISIRGNIASTSGAILLGYAYQSNQPCGQERLDHVCSKNITSGPGVIASPYYPTYFPPNIHCTWHITAPETHVVQLAFNYFFVGFYEKTTSSLEVYDGDPREGKLLGSFCDYKTPKFLRSLSNSMTIIFDSGFISLARGFNISYRFIEVSKYAKSCAKKSRGCPESCNCRWYLSGDVKRIAVKCKSLTDLPSKIPYETSALMLQENQINTIPNHAFANLPNLLYVDISNNRIFRIKPEAFNNGTSIEVIRLNMNFLMEIPQKTFRPLEHLKTLDLGRNLIKDLTKNTFSGLSELSVLSLRLNRIVRLSQDIFNPITNLTHLYLQDNNISSLPDGVFQHLSKLIFLNLKDNSLKHLSRNTFRGLLSLMHLNLQGNKLSTISQSLFDDLKRLKTLKVDKFIHCCYAEKAITGVKCESLESNEFSSCDDLMKNTALRIFLWILGLSALVGNLLVICKRISGKEMRQNTNSLLLTNLAITDFLMGVYLITIASFDIKWKGEYFKHDVDWRSGVGCRITGMISMLSSVVSVAFLAIVTYDRLICVVFPFTVKKLSWRKALCICGCVWIVGLVTSIIPIFDFDYFLNDEDDFVGFYGRASVCLPLQLSSNLQAGWEYSVALFLAFPFIAFMFMLIAYIAILRTVQRSANAVRGSTSLKRESSLAKRVVFIILTDFLCWMPVIIISFLSITGIYSDPSKQMYVWIAIFVLPINSSINPFLYTFTTVKTVKSKGQDPGGNMRDNLPAKPLRLKKLLENIDVDGEKKASKICYTIKLLEKVDIKKYFEGEGLFLAKAKSHGYEELSLIKYFNQGKLDAFKKEVDILSELKEHKHENIIEYRWSCLANEHLTDGKPFNIKEIESASLICYEYVPNKVLENFLQDEDEFSSSILCSLSLNIISAIEFLQDCGFSNNSINARSIIVREGESKNAVPVRAVLVDFSRANKLRVYDDGYYAKTDIIQFGRLLKIFLKACNDLALFRQVDEVLSLCDKERTSTTTTLIKNLLMEMLLETAETTAI